jgi:hypothetical protein
MPPSSCTSGCLHADRSRGVLDATYEELATALSKSADEVGVTFRELILQRVFRRREDRSIEITDDFWPYHRESPHLPPEGISAYLETVKRLFLAHACVQSSFSIADRKLSKSRGFPSSTSSGPFIWGVCSSMPL